MSRYAELLNELEALANNPPEDAQERKALLNGLRNAQFAVERPIDIMFRLGFTSIQSAVARACMDLKLFRIIAERSTPINLEELAAETLADALLLRRLLRFCSLYGLVNEPTPMHYLPSPATKCLAEPGMEAGVRHHVDITTPPCMALPEFLASTNYKNPTDSTQTPFQIAHNTKDQAFIWGVTRPEVMANFHAWMAALCDISPSWLDVFPHEQLTQNTTSTSPVFIDIGGGNGYKCQELKKRVPQLTRGVILQDLAPAIQVALPTPGVENTVYNFWNPQPIQNASFYYIKSVLHDWPDEKAIEILKNQVPALGPDSVMLIDEIVLPERGGHWQAVEMDISLMSAAAAVERTVGQWNDLLAKAGLVVEKTYTYDDQMLSSVMVVRKAS